MTKTRLTIITALVLTMVFVALALGRNAAERLAERDQRTRPVWEVTLEANGTFLYADDWITTVRPPAFRQQHIFNERFISKQLIHRKCKPRIPGRNKIIWRAPELAGGPLRFQARCTFCCVLSCQPTPAMNRSTAEIDAETLPGIYWTTFRNTAANREIAAMGLKLVPSERPAIERVKVFYDYVSKLGSHPPAAQGDSSAEKKRGREPSPYAVDTTVARASGAVSCLRQGWGDSRAKSRLLVALCRSQGIPARLVMGLELTEGQELVQPHYWMEAWVEGQWLPMCTTNAYFGKDELPANYLILQLGDFKIVRGSSMDPEYSFRVRRPLRGLLMSGQEAFQPGQGDNPSSILERFWQKVTLSNLEPAEQDLTRFLLLFPLGALIVSIFRTLIGLQTFGTFAPALLGMAFLDLKALPWGLFIFLLTILVGWGMRHFVDRYHLLLVPRISVVYTSIILFLIVMIVVTSNYGIPTTKYLRLFPLVILTHLVERFWTIEVEDGPVASFKTLLGTIVVAVTVCLALSPLAVKNWMFRYPETIFLILAAQLLLGRYTGYRLAELYRFGDLLEVHGRQKGTT